MTGPSTGRHRPRRDEPHRPLSLDLLLKPDFPARQMTPDGCRLQGDDGWVHISQAIHLDPETYVPQEVIPDEVRTRINADRGRPHPIPNRPDPVPDENEDDFFNDPGTWEFREELRECEACGEPFLANVYNHRYCSAQCARKGRSFTRVCRECGAQFETDRTEQLYCSIQCSGHAKRNPANDRKCRECGAAFHATRPQQRFCSRACAWSWRKRERER